MKHLILAVLVITGAGDACADSFRCGTRIVVTGDPVSRLLRNCGQPAFRYAARERIARHGRGEHTGVTNWVYERNGKKAMIVSVHGGRVVKISVE